MKPRRHALRIQMAAAYAAVTAIVGIAFLTVSFGIVERNTAGLYDALFGLSVITLVALAAGWGIARYALKPLQSVTAKAQQISATNLHQRIGLQGPDDELQQLSTTIDALLARLEASFERERRFVANAAHEIRTPLAVTRTTLEVGLNNSDATIKELRHVITQALGATARTETLAADLLLLARSESVPIERSDQLDLAEITREVMNTFTNPTNVNGIRVSYDLLPAPMRGNAGLIDRLIVNLIDNAMRHNIQNGWTNIATKTEANQAILTVENPIDNAGQEPIDQLLEPFRRGVDTPTTTQGHGLGLGLSIVQAISIGHGASLAASRSDNVFRVEVCFEEQGIAIQTDGQMLPQNRRLQP